MFIGSSSTPTANNVFILVRQLVVCSEMNTLDGQQSGPSVQDNFRNTTSGTAVGGG